MLQLATLIAPCCGERIDVMLDVGQPNVAPAEAPQWLQCPYCLAWFDVKLREVRRARS